MIQRFEKFSFTIAEISHYWHKLASSEMQTYGLKGPHAVYLTTMYQYPDGITAGHLAELCSRDKADVSRAIAQLERLELVEKTEGSCGRYKAALRLTEAGNALAANVTQKALRAVNAVGAGLSPAQRDNFYDVLDVICQKLRRLSETGLQETCTLAEECSADI